MASLARLSSALSDVTYHLSNAPASPAPEQSQNAFGAVTKVIHQDWQAGSSAIEQSSVSGQITSVHSSSESLLSSIPTLYRLSQDRIPTVFHVNARAPSKTSASFHPDHTHVLAIRQTGLGLISSDSPQEALDVALLAHLAALKTGTPVLHFFTAPSVFKADAEAFSPALNQLAEVLPAQQLQEFRQRFAPVKAEKKPAKPAEGEQKPEGGEQPKEQQQQDLVKVIEEISSGLADKFPGQFGGGYRAFEYHGSEQAELAIVTLASGSAQIEEAVKALAKSGQKVGILKVRVFRPWSEARFLSVLPKSVRKLAVLEQTAVGGSPSTSWGPLFMDVTTSFHSAEAQQQQPPLIVGGQFGLGGFPLDHSSVASVFANLGAPQPASGFTLQPPSQASPTSAIASPLPGGSPPAASTAENHYTQMLRQVFGDNLVLSNATGYSTVWGEAKSEAQTQELLKTKASRLEEVGAEFGLGMYLALNQRRERLAEVITRVLGDAQVPKSDELRETLRLWLQNREDRKLSRQHANTLGDRLLPKEASNHPALQEILLQRELLPLATNWIVGGDDWAYDMNSSGIHHILSSGEKVNLLILDTEPYTQTVGQGNHATQRKKDIGLYAMNYGGAYVASVALYSSYSQAIRAFVEAATYPGPAIILAYLPKVIAEAQPQERFPTSASAALAVLKETKQAVDAGHWPLYRWNPSLEDESGSAVDTGRGPFALDSQKILQDLQTFLEKENHLSLLTKSDPYFAANLAGSLDQQLKIRHEGVKQAAQDSFSKLLGGLKGGKPLLVLFGSDGGNAEGVARRIEDGAKRRGMDARCLAMDEYPLEDLAAEPTLCLVVSTAGQGEFPTNAREFWKALSNATDLNLANTKFAVFAMGDRHYWPLPEDAVYFCKPGNDLDAKLQLLSAQRLLAPGIGDDQDADGYETGFAAWEPQFWRSLGLPEVIGGATAAPKAKSVEEIKDDSNFLRGTIMQGLADTSTGAISESDTALTKFHGIYQQDDRDLRDERRKQGLEKAFSFMVRVRVPGGISTPKQWLDMDEIADKHANGTLKLTTRQAFQVHGVLKRNLRQTIRDINKSLMDTIAACGDVNRNVMCNPNPYLSEIHMEVQAFTQRLSDHLTPRTSAYHEIWLEDKQVGGNADVNRPSKADEEPIYGPHYLPRKFKTVVAIPPNNDVDIYAHDLGYIAITEGSKLVGFNVTIGGGMGMTHNNKKTFPRLADLLGFCTLDQAIAVGEAVVTVQRDYGDRTNRKHARLKYTIEDKGLDWYREQVEARVGFKLQPVRPFEFTDNSDRYGWTQGLHGNWHFCMFVQNGRVRDSPNFALKTGLKEIAKVHEGDFRLTPNQNLIIGNITPKNKPVIEALLKKYDITNDRHSALRLNSMACVALPTCGLAFAESERYLPDLVTKIENTIEECGLREDAITIRMTGCPNGCARPYVAEIAFVGKAPGVYNMYLGAGFSGDRLNKLYKESVNEEQILTELKPLLKRYATERLPQEHFGDFVIRAGIVKAVLAGRDFHS